MKRFAGFFNPQIEPPEAFAFFQLTGSAFGMYPFVEIQCFF